MKLNNFNNKSRLLIYIFSLWFGLIILSSCANSEPDTKKTFTEKELKEPLIEANKKAIVTEDQQIKDFIARNRWDVKETGTGLRYRIYESGSGERAEIGKIAIISYKVSLLNGETVYSSDELGNKEFKIGRGGVESGLEEGILLLRVGDRAKFIIPSHLAFGLLGDQNKIFTKTTLVYDLKLLDLK